MSLFINIFTKFFFVLAPFFVLSMFLALTKGMTKQEQHGIAIRTTISTIVLCGIIFFFGNPLFRILGITLDSFRIGAGALLFLSAVALVQGNKDKKKDDKVDPGEGDISVVPLAIPIAVGPATVGVMMVMGAGLGSSLEKAIGFAAMSAAVVCLGVILFMASRIKRALGNVGIEILTKLSGLVLAALAAQIVFTGIKNFMQ
ncbi:MarC family protein [Desulfobaculum senezii]|uniref:MarC family protein n=1 Tax=Desulfobaculum sp. SPO524 TaxID=3378071 RepID=UPI003853BFD4